MLHLVPDIVGLESEQLSVREELVVQRLELGARQFDASRIVVVHPVDF